MKFLLDFLPILLFFIAFKVAGIYVATGVAITATLLQIAYLRAHTGKVEPMQWVSLGIIVVFGGATLLAHDESFIKWKPTVLYWLMSAALMGGTLMKRNIIKTLLGTQMTLPDSVWPKLNWSWGVFFAFMGALNLWVASHYDTDTWVSFKLFGGMGLMLVFVVAQALVLSRYLNTSDAP
jgi:intracellular septation protein